MLTLCVLFGIAGIIIFHNFPPVVYMFIWYTLIVTCFWIEEKIESRK